MQKPDWGIITILCIKLMIQIKQREQEKVRYSLQLRSCDWSHRSVLPVRSSSSANNPNTFKEDWFDTLIQRRASSEFCLQLRLLPPPPSLPFRWTVLLGDRISVSIKFKLWSLNSPQFFLWWPYPLWHLCSLWVHNVLYGSGCFGARVLDLTDPWRCCPIRTLNLVCGYAPSNLRRISSRRHCFPSLQPAVNRRKTKEASVGVLIIRHSEHQLSDFRLSVVALEANWFLPVLDFVQIQFQREDSLMSF